MAFDYCLELQQYFHNKPIELDRFLSENLEKDGILEEIEFVDICIASLEQLITSLNRHQFERQPDYVFQHVLDEIRMTCYEEKFEDFDEDDYDEFFK